MAAPKIHSVTASAWRGHGAGHGRWYNFISPVSAARKGGEFPD